MFVAAVSHARILLIEIQRYLILMYPCEDHCFVLKQEGPNVFYLHLHYLYLYFDLFHVDIYYFTMI